MMIPIPRARRLPRRAGVDAARGVSLVDDVRITAKPDQLLLPLPEGASYLGFIFARGGTARQVDARAAGRARAAASSRSTRNSGCYNRAHGSIVVMASASGAAPRARTRAAGRSSARSFRRSCRASTRRRGRASSVSGSTTTFGGGVEALGRANEDDPQRVPPDAVAEGGAGPRRQAHGGLLLRRRRGASARVRARNRRSDRASNTPEARHRCLLVRRRLPTFRQTSAFIPSRTAQLPVPLCATPCGFLWSATSSTCGSCAAMRLLQTDPSVAKRCTTLERHLSHDAQLLESVTN